MLTSGPGTHVKVSKVSNELRGIQEMLEDLAATERQALDAIAAEEAAKREDQKVRTIRAVVKVLEMRDALAEQIEVKLADLLADLGKFDAMSLDTRIAACKYGRPETIEFLTPKPASEIMFDRLVALEGATIASISRAAGGRLAGHLTELLPLEMRPVDDSPEPPAPEVTAASVEEDDEDFVDDLPPLEEV